MLVISGWRVSVPVDAEVGRTQSFVFESSPTRLKMLVRKEIDVCDGCHVMTFAHVVVDVAELSRCRFSASPATGLIGMQENAFLSDFFASVGFLPLATKR